MRLLLIGQAPSEETDGKPPFTGRCGKFLAELMGTSQEQMLKDHDFVNVLERWPGKGIGGDKFPIPEATVAAKKILPSLQNRTVVLLGANVARAFGATGFKYFEFYQIRNPEKLTDVIVPTMTIVPHPSGRNRFWNKPENRYTARKFFNGLTAQKP